MATTAIDTKLSRIRLIEKVIFFSPFGFRGRPIRPRCLNNA
jgi:hypothetical protein